MNRRTLSMLFLFAAGLVLFSSSAMAQRDSDLVLAAKEKSASKAKHVYTNADFPESPRANSSVSSTATLPAGSDIGNTRGSDKSTEAKTPDTAASQIDTDKNAGTKTDAKPDGQTEAASKQKAKLDDLKDKLAQTKRDEEALQQKLDTLDEKAKGEKDEFRKNMYLDMVSNQQVTLSDYRRKEEQLQKQISDEGKDQQNSNKAQQ